MSYFLGDDTTTYSASTKCSDIPAGDPYRVPGNSCTTAGGAVVQFDANGNVSEPSPLLTPTNIAVGAAVAVAAWVIFGKKRR